MSTTAGAAAAPLPRTSARLPLPGGTTRRTISRRGSGRAGVDIATGFLAARMRPDHHALEPCHARTAKGMGDANADLESARVSRLVAEEHQVERTRRCLVGPNRVGDRAGGGLALPLVGLWR